MADSNRMYPAKRCRPVLTKAAAQKKTLTYGRVADPTIADPTIADAIMDRLAFHSHRIELTGDTVRRKLYAVD